MATHVLLSESNYCRLCAEINDNGSFLFGPDENKQVLSDLVNTYLPLKVDAHSRLPQTICPGCNIQLEATKNFFDLIIEGQLKLRDLLTEQTEIENRQVQQKQELEEYLKTVNPNSSVESYSIQTDESGDTFFIRISSDGPLFPPEHELAIKASVLEKPRKKRGRPTRSQQQRKQIEESVNIFDVSTTTTEETVEEDILDSGDGRRRRKVRLPSRFSEVLQGKELDKALEDEGVIDEYSRGRNRVRLIAEDAHREQDDQMEVIGHVQDVNGDLQELVVSRSLGAPPKYTITAKAYVCPYCVRSFKSVGRYKAHVAFHKPPIKYQCVHSGCVSLFDSEDLLEAHQVKAGHNGFATVTTTIEHDTSPCEDGTSANVQCNVCLAVFVDSDSLEKHMDSHNIQYGCNTCNNLFDAQNLLRTHQNETGHVGVTLIESVNYEDLQSDNLQVNKTVEYANYDAISKSEDENSADYPDESTDTASDTFHCDQCSKSFSCKQNLDVHNKAVHMYEKPFTCVYCNKSFSQRYAYKTHLLQHTKRCYKCNLCNKDFQHASSLVYHKESEHNAGRTYVCKKCPKTFKHKQLLVRHQFVHTDMRPYVCKTCNNTFKTKTNLIHHQETHTGEKKYECGQCSASYAHKTSLNMHLLWHAGQKQFECDVCQKLFSQKGNLAEHRRIHTGEKPYACNLCERKFTTSSQHKLHLKRHAGEKPWRCEYCNKTFLHVHTWRTHTRRHRDERPFQCRQCMRSFTEKWALKKHMRIHSGERPFKCDLCNKTFADSSNLTKHKRVHAKNEAAAAQAALRHVNEEIPTIITPGVDALTLPLNQELLSNGNLLYVSYGNDADNSEQVPQTVVQIVGDSVVKTQEEQPHTISIPEQNVNLSQFNLNETLHHLVDQEGVPISVTTTDGHEVKVFTTVGAEEHMVGMMPDGTLVALNLPNENETELKLDALADIQHPEMNATNSAVTILPTEPNVEEKVAMLHEESIDKVNFLSETTNVLSEVLEQQRSVKIDFLTEDCQNVSLVYEINPSVADQYLK